MIAVYLGAELDSDRFGPQLRGRLARDGQELASADAAYRRRLLDEHRGYGTRTGMFEGFPRAVDWFRAALSREEVLDGRYTDYSWWVELSGWYAKPARDRGSGRAL